MKAPAATSDNRALAERAGQADTSTPEFSGQQPTDSSLAERAASRRWFWWILVAVLGLRLGYIAEIRRHPEQGFPDICILQGTPWFDARTWHDLGEDLAAGRGIHIWEGRRPLYAWLLGAIYAVGGVRYELALAANALCGALAVAGAFLVAEAWCGRWLALALATRMALEPVAFSCAATTLSETLGLALLVWHVWAWQRGLASGELAQLGWAGVWLGLSNVARPLTLLSAPGLVLVTVGALGRPWKRALWGGLYVAAGVTVTVAPFVAWNYGRNGILTLSDNTAGDLYGVAAPHWGRWEPAIERELTERKLYQVQERYDWLMGEVRRHLREHPEVFATRVRDYFVQALVVARSGAWWCLPVVLLSNLPSAWRRRRIPWLSLLLVGGVVGELWLTRAGDWAELPGPLRAALLTTLVVPAITWRDRRGLFLGNLVLATLVAVSLFGSFMDRLFLMFEWALWLWLLGGWQRLLVAAGEGPALAGAPAGSETPSPLAGDRALAWGGRVVGGLLALGLCLVFARHWLLPAPPPAWADPLACDPTPALSRLMVERPEPFLAAERAVFPPGSRLRTSAHWFDPPAHGQLTYVYGQLDSESPYFPGPVPPERLPLAIASRDYPRTLLAVVFFGPNGDWGTHPLLWPGDERRQAGKYYLVLGRWNLLTASVPVIEGLVRVPWDPETQEVDTDRAEWALASEPHAQSLAELQRAAESSPALEDVP